MRKNHKTPEQKIQEFWSRIDTTGECHLYTGSLDANGYGNFCKGAPRPLQVKAHRFAYELHTGERYPPWRPIGHLCANRHCVRIEHLQLGEDKPSAKYKNRQSGPRPQTWKHGPSEALKDLNMAFLRARAQAKYRGEDWRLTFDEFVKRWAGRYAETGIKSDCTVMVRSDPTGAWSFDNTELMQRGENQGRMMRIKRNAGLSPTHRFNHKEKKDETDTE